MNRRESIITLGMLCASLPLTLYSKDDGRLSIQSDNEEVKFRIGKDAFMLRPNSQIELFHDGLFTKALTLVAGGVMGVFGGGEKIITTKTFTAGIRGTGLYLQEYANDAVYSCLCYGKGDYYNAKTNEVLLSLESTYHDKPVQIVQSKSGKIEYEISKLNNHNDDELHYLEKMCDRVVPFKDFLKNQQSKGSYHSYY